MGAFIPHTQTQRLIAVMFLFVSFSSLIITANSASSSSLYSIQLHEFRWNKFPLKILVEMNQWSQENYALAVREGINSWVNSVWNYTNSFTSPPLRIDYLYYVSTINSTTTYDILVSFAAAELSQGTHAVGLTTYKIDLNLHVPIAPIIINVTTYSAKADSLFVKNVVMHELGHALGLGHASTQNTENGPELMYPTLSMNRVIYPSTLNAHGLSMLYKGNYGQTVYLPNDVPYMMLGVSNTPPPLPPMPLNIFYPVITEVQNVFRDPLEIVRQPNILLVPSVLWMVIAIIFGLLLHSGTMGGLVTSTISLLIAYSFSSNEVNLIMLIGKIGLLLPSILIGASIGSFIIQKYSQNKQESDFATIDGFDEWI